VRFSLVPNRSGSPWEGYPEGLQAAGAMRHRWANPEGHIAAERAGLRVERLLTERRAEPANTPLEPFAALHREQPVQFVSVATSLAGCNRTDLLQIKKQKAKIRTPSPSPRAPFPKAKSEKRQFDRAFEVQRRLTVANRDLSLMICLRPWQGFPVSHF
jgi:hypothetical protein